MVVPCLLLLTLLVASWADLREVPVLVVAQQVLWAGRHTLMMVLLAGRTRLSSRQSSRA